MKNLKNKMSDFISEKELEAFHYIEMVYTDPITISEIIGIAIALIDVLNKKEDNSEVLNEISRKLTEISSKLNLIIDYLENISIQIDEQFKKLVKTELTARMTVINENLSVWTDKDLLKTHVQSEIMKYQTDLNISAKQAMEYGYAHYITMIYALKTELILLYSNSLYDDQKRNLKSKFLLNSYKVYFKNSLNEKIKGSFTNVLKPLLATIEKYETEFIKKNFSFKAEVISGNGDDQRINFYTLSLSVNGSLSEGFIFSENEKLTDSRWTGRGSRRNFVPLELYEQNLNQARAQIASIKSQFNSASELYNLKLTPKKYILENSIKTVRQTVELIDEKVKLLN
ncbi:hypothetical protein [uncultured Maribacter sp.]|uniref:hypothetical protein n=1 Tax=uncultured Maribacter sp. TaxID=431308 RepID=UPI00261780ED|nr:hypothetical protein [uncultured Maribacter sp.]